VAFLRAGRVPLAARFVPPGLFYGWVVAAACAVLSFFTVGVGYYALAVFLKPLRDEHHWSTALVSGATGMYFSVAGLTAAILGPLIDRHGPLAYLAGGTILGAVCAALIGFVETPWQLYAVYFFFAIAYGVSGGVTVNAIMARWFIRWRARAMMVSATGISMGGVVLAPLSSWLISAGGLELAAPLLGGLVAVVGLPMVLLVIATDPGDLHLQPDGGRLVATQRHSLSTSAQFRVWTRREAMNTAGFWAILVAFLLVLTAQTGYLIHQIAFLEGRFGSRNEAAFALSVTAGGSVIARTIVGLFADGIDRRWLTAFLFALQATAVLLILATENLAATWVLTLVIGLTVGNIYMMQSLLVGEIFGLASFASVLGLVALAGQIGSGFGPLGVGLLHDASDGYGVPFVVTAVLTYAAAAVVLFARPASAVEAQQPAVAQGAAVAVEGQE